jgi:hypothetical protein
MPNPFEKRATEYLRDDEAAFLSIVSPEPLRRYLADHAKKGQLFEKLIRIVGSPGSGKTTLATLLESRVVEAVLADPQKEGYAEIIEALDACNFVENGQQKIAAVRLPMEGEYRDFWELPYDEALRTKLILALIQARSVLGLVRNLEKRHRKDQIVFVPRKDALAALDEIGGVDTSNLVDRAREVERAVYDIGARLVPPKSEDISQAAARPFRPFDVIEAIELIDDDGTRRTLKPLVILDDAHNLSPRQFAPIFRDLARREIRIGRWIMMRFDALAPATAFGGDDDSLAPELKPGRDYVDVFFQASTDRKKSRTAFRGMSKNMADRYLRQHPAFIRRDFKSFSPLLSTEPDRLSSQAHNRLVSDIERVRSRLHVSPDRLTKLRQEVQRYAHGAKSQDVGPDVQVAMLRILIHRYTNRVPQKSLFEGEISDPTPRQEVKADAEVAEGARVYLRHTEGRALHYGISAISDASSENAELFLNLAGALVDRMEARIINGNSPKLTAKQQDQILADRAEAMMDGWNFPFADRVRALVDRIAADCVAESLLPNAPLGQGANAVAIPQSEFEQLLNGQNALGQILYFASAYNAVTITPKYGQGNKEWCLVELGGPLLLKHSLTLLRGGFLERQAIDLTRYAELQV